MTQEEKQLLLVDLSARLPYEVRGFYKTSGIEITSQKLTYDIIGNLEYKNNVEFKPYLFPLSSMAEEQKEELRLEHEKDVKTMANCLKKCSEGDTSLIGKNILYHAVDWCDKNHFDYRGLIKEGLAIDCTNLNIY